MSRSADEGLRLASAGRPTKTTSLYRALTQEQRVPAVEFMLQDDPAFRASMIRRFVLRVGGFRPETLRSWPPNRLAREIVRRGLEAQDDEEFLLGTFYMNVEPELQSAFLDANNVPNHNGIIADEAVRPFGTVESVTSSAVALYRQFGGPALHYLQCVHQYDSNLWVGMDEAMAAVIEAVLATVEEKLAPFEVEPPPASETGIVAESAQEEAYPYRLSPPEKGELHLLDDVMTVALINAANGVDGALPREAANRLVAEFVRVNGQRHQSWYAAGLYRALIDSDGEVPGPGEAPGARRWFLAGQVAGLTRRNDLAAVGELFTADPECRQLGDDGLGASGEAAPNLFAALWGLERFGDAVAFVRPAAAAQSIRLFSTIFDRATALLALRSWDKARPAFDLLWEALELRRSRNQLGWEDRRVFIERRQAHCRRLAGEFQAACAILQPMLDDDRIEPEIRGMMQVDVALMDVGYRELAELDLPVERTEAARIARALDGVRSRVDAALVLDPDGAAHARYVLGFQALLQENGTAALEHLERSLSAFRARPEVYTREGLLDRAELYHALAVCLHHDPSVARVRDAADRINATTVQELRIPGWMLGSVLTGITMADQERASALAAGLLRERPAEVVDQFMSLATELRPVAVALSHLALDHDRPMARRLEAARRAIPALIQHGALDEADSQFMMLIAQAMSGVGRQETIALLGRREPLLQLRDNDELMALEAQLLMAAGNSAAAVALWSQLAHQCLAEDAPWKRAEAAVFIDRMAELAEADLVVDALREQLRRVESRLEPPVPPRKQRTVRLLVVGGDEMQARYDEGIKEILRDEAPYIVPTFITTGWSANWGDTAREVIRRLEDHDGLVMHYFIRTIFGRTVRKAAGSKPWRSVGGHGRDGILRGIYACAEAVIAME